MLGAIAGDIIGSRFEGHSSVPVGFDLFHGSCQFTDDTVCTVAVADAILNTKGFAEKLRGYARRYPMRGYGAQFHKWAMAENAPAYGSWGNGAPMRVSSVGWLAEDEASVLYLATEQASVTHNHSDAIAGSKAVALAIFLAYPYVGGRLALLSIFRASV